MSRIVELLRGSRSKALLAYGAEGCPSYGAYQAWSKPSMTRLVKDLIDSGYLHVEGLEYPTLDVTRLGQEVLQGSQRCITQKDQGASKKCSALVSSRVSL